MKNQTTASNIQDLRAKLILKEKEYHEALEAKKRFEDVVKIFSEKSKIEEEIKRLDGSSK